MGIDCHIYLPRTCGIRNVANVIGALAGLKAEKRHFSTKPEGYSVEVEGIEIDGSGSMPQSPVIRFRGKMVDGDTYHQVMYHFENKRGIFLNPPSTNFWVAIGKKLVDIFGGEVDYSDCDEIKIDYCNANHGSIEQNRPQGGDDWYRFHDMVLNLKPLTQEDMDYAYDKP